MDAPPDCRAYSAWKKISASGRIFLVSECNVMISQKNIQSVLERRLNLSKTRSIKDISNLMFICNIFNRFKGQIRMRSSWMVMIAYFPLFNDPLGNTFVDGKGEFRGEEVICHE
jgi:hypothetical protein